MSNTTGPLFETTYVVSNAAREEFEPWLRELQTRAMREAGIEDARGFESESTTDGAAHITFRFRATDDLAMDSLLDGYFVEIEGEVEDLFGANVVATSRVLREDASRLKPSAENSNCLNCGTRLRGQYCGSCGQRARNRLISLWELLSEAFGDLLELDSRLWRTLIPLLARPGQLTRDYLEGRRARYMPPFRSYLVLSVIFFVVAFFDPQRDLSIFFEPPPEPTAEEIAAAEQDATAAAAEKEQKIAEAKEKLAELDAEGVFPEALVEEIADDDDEWEIRLGGDDENSLFDDCENASISDEEDMPEWLRKRLTDERVRSICERNKARGVENFSGAIVDNIPIALIVLLPLMALVLKLLYPLSRRYFVEHLLFFIHFHAFFFLILILQILFARIVGWVSLDGAISTIILVATSFYIPVYLYKAMRHVYGQGHLVTLFKYLLLMIAYLTGATTTMFAAFLIAIVSA
ncbi:MAG: DUF4286 family protein [Gammaproteobacteria bacterium]|nr:DUF4286 family protein [Gammaproteobacteria bacterium]